MVVMAVLIVARCVAGVYNKLVGGISFTVILNAAVAVPPLFVAVIVYNTAVVCKTVGVPLIWPEVALKFMPLGRLGAML
jgi:hypothetical protein